MQENTKDVQFKWEHKNTKDALRFGPNTAERISCEGTTLGRNIVHGKQSKDFSVVLWCLYLSFSSWPFTEIVWSTAIVCFLLVGWCLVRSEMPKGTPEIFYRTVQFWEDVNPPPVFVGSVFSQLRARTATKFTSSMSSATACTLSSPQRYGHIVNAWVLE